MARILSIEDDEELQRLVGHVLHQEGYEVHYAWNGVEGYEKALLLKPDLILLDLMLPRLNGVEFLTKLRRTPGVPDIPVIIVTAHADAVGMLHTAMGALGAQRCLNKPVDIPELVSAVKAVLADFPPAGQAPTARSLRKGSVSADARSRAVWIDDRLVATLTYKEFALLQRLIESPGPVPKADLLRALGYEQSQGDALKQTIRRLRQGLGLAGMGRVRTTPEGYELEG